MTLRILCVEDHDNVRAVLATLIDALGHECTMVTDGGDAIAIVDSSAADYDLLLSDLRLPGADGIELAEHAREKRRQLPVVIISGYMTTADESRIEALSAVALHKPFSVEDLERAIARAVELVTVE